VSTTTLPAPATETPDDATVRDGVEVVTFGCRLNAYESEVIRVHAVAAGLKDAVVVNTCAVTAEAVRQARQAIRKLRRERPEARIVVTGCAAQTDPQAFAAMPEIDLIVGNAEKMEARIWKGLGNSLGAPDTEKVRVDDIMSVTETAHHLIDGLADRVRTYIQVQNGCDHRCTFCIIPYGRGNSRSVPAGEVVTQVRRLVDNGVAEVVLTGVDITSWGGDLPGAPKLGRLVRAILEGAPDLPRLRLSSLDAVEIDPELYDFVTEEPRVAPHLHLSLQAGDDLILKRMKRRHSRAQAIELCARLKAARPEIAFGADLIAGFPTEDEAMFANTLALVDDCRLAFTHVFPFSPRPGTPAARMPQLDREVVKERAARLRAKGAEALAQHLESHVGSEHDVLVEREDFARLADFSPLRLPSSPARAGSIVRAHVLASDGAELSGEVVS
jgi:threonylcarbamoyladenosine tRNA methylthiotransferase MtaB